jgi:hypothetical protein
MTLVSARSESQAADAEIEKARRRAKRASKKQLEDVEQMRFVEWARERKGWVCMHVPNELGRSGNYARARWLKKMGLLPGAPDILLMTELGNFALEFKAEWEEPSKEQVKVMSALRDHGWRVAVVYSAEEAVRFLGMQMA